MASKFRHKLSFPAIMVVCFFLTLGAWSLSSPVASSPDEGDILASIWCANGNKADVCQVDSSGIWHVPSGVYNWCFQHHSDISGACGFEIKSKQLVPAVEQIRVAEYSKFLGLLATDNINLSVVSIRILNDFIASILLFITLIISNRRSQFVVGIATAVLLVPNSLYLLSTAHPSGLNALVSLLAVTSATQIRISKWFETVKELHTINLLFLMLLIFLVRRDSFLLVDIGVSLLLVWRTMQGIQITKKLVLTTGGILLIGGIVLASIKTWAELALTSLPLTLNIWGTTAHPDRASWNVLTTNIQNIPSLMIGQFGYWGLGALDVPMPIIVWFIVSATITAMIVVGILFAKPKSRFLFGSTLVLYIFLTLQILQNSKLYVGEEMQPRYLFGLLVIAICGLLAQSELHKLREFSVNGSILILAVLIVFAHSIALWTTLRRYTSGLDAGELDLNHAREWWWATLPIGPNQVWLLGTLSFLCFLLATMRFVHVGKGAKSELIGS